LGFSLCFLSRFFKRLVAQSGLATLSGWGSSLAQSFSYFATETKERAKEMQGGGGSSVEINTPQPGV
jgi:hypothetical protein